MPPLPLHSDDKGYKTIGAHKNEELVNVEVLVVDLGVVVQIAVEVVTVKLNVRTMNVV